MSGVIRGKVKRTFLGCSYAAAILAFALTGCSKPPSDQSSVATATGDRTPVVVISIDTLRSDRLPAYGYPDGSTPAIDSLRRDAVLFSRAYSHAPLTLPSHTSLFTGLLPNEHGVRDNFGNRVLKGEFEDLFYLPKALQAEGYETAGVVSTFVLRSGTGFSKGFDFFDDTIERETQERDLQRPALESVQSAIDWLGEGREKPFFLLVHLYDPHAPFEAPAEFAERFESAYDAEIAYADSAVQKLLEHLKKIGVYDEALIVLLSDHGEGLLDHGEEEHGVFLYREAIQVPLILKLPKNESAASTADQAVGLFDVAPTILEVLGLDVPDGLSGTSLLTETSGRKIYSESIYPRSHFGWRELFSLTDGTFHYIDAPRPELYRMDQDPGELENIALEERPTLTEFRRSLDEYDTTVDLSNLEDEDDDTREKLAALGYIGNVSLSEGDLPDPKDGIGALESLRRAFVAQRDGRLEDTLTIVQGVVEDQPQMVDAWELKGRTLAKMNRKFEAIQAFKEALRLSQGNAKILIETATLLSETGDQESAREHAALAAEYEPTAFQTLAQIAIRQGNLDQAREDVAAGRDNANTPLLFKRIEAEIELADENWTRALELTREVEAKLGESRNQDVSRGLFFTQGRALMQLGDKQGAERALVQEITRSPDSLAAYTHLALLYGTVGNGPKVGEILKMMVDANPNPLAYADAVRTLLFLGDQRAAVGVLREALSRWPNSPELAQVIEQNQG